MRSGHLLFSAFHFFIICVVVGGGIFILVLPYADYMRLRLIAFLTKPSELCFLIGAVVIGVGAILFAILYVMNRRRYFQLEMGGGVVAVEELLIRSAALDYFKAIFPNHELVADVVVRGKSMIEIIMTLPRAQEEEFFSQVEQELGVILARRFGYQKPFTLTFVET